MNPKNPLHHSRPARLLGSLVFAFAIHLATGYTLGSVPTQGQRYAQAHFEESSSMANIRMTGRHHLLYV